MLALTLLIAATTAACPQNLANGLETPATAKQLITVEAKVARTTYATLRTWRRAGTCWVAVAGPYTARVGQNGLSASRREGDGTTPTGMFRIGRTMYGNEPNPGVQLPLPRAPLRRLVGRGSVVADLQHVPARPLRRRAAVRRRQRGDVAAAEGLSVPGGGRVQHAARVPGRGSGIFLHAQTGGPTIGCVSLQKEQLRAVLRWLRPEAAPVIAIGTTAQLRG